MYDLNASSHQHPVRGARFFGRPKRIHRRSAESSHNTLIRRYVYTYYTHTYELTHIIIMYIRRLTTRRSYKSFCGFFHFIFIVIIIIILYVRVCVRSCVRMVCVYVRVWLCVCVCACERVWVYVYVYCPSGGRGAFGIKSRFIFQPATFEFHRRTGSSRYGPTCPPVKKVYTATLHIEVHICTFTGVCVYVCVYTCSEIQETFDTFVKWSSRNGGGIHLPSANCRSVRPYAIIT